MANRYAFVPASSTKNWHSDAATVWSSSASSFVGASEPTSADSVAPQNSWNTAAILSLDASASCLNMDWTGATNTPRLAFGTNSINFYGNVTFIAAMSTTGIPSMTASGSGSISLTTNGLTLSCGVQTSDSFTGTLTIVGALNIGSQQLALQKGTINTGNQTITCGEVKIVGAGLAQVLTLGSSIVNCTSWNYVSGNFTITANTATINVTGTGAFAGGGLTYNNVTVQGAGNYTLTITGNNTFNNFTVDASQANKTIVATGTTQTYNRLLRDRSTNAITMTGGNWVSKLHYQTVLDYMVMTNIVSLSPQTLYVGRHSTNGGGNVNVYFTDIPISNSMLIRIGGRIVCL